MLYVDPAAGSFALRDAMAAGGAAREAAALEEFEHLFLGQLMREMRKTVPDGGLFEKSSSQQYFEEILDDHLAGEMARSGQFGIARAMQAQLDAADAALKAGAVRDATGPLPLHPPRAGIALGGTPEGIALPKRGAGLPLPERAAGLPLDPGGMVKETAGAADRKAGGARAYALQGPGSKP